jgi:hypothetical protein
MSPQGSWRAMAMRRRQIVEGKKKEAPDNTPPNPAQQKRTKDDWEKRERGIKENTKNTKYKRKSG